MGGMIKPFHFVKAFTKLFKKVLSKMLRRKIISLVQLSFHIANTMERRSRSKERFVFVIRILILDIV